jgi:hypothetical protein
MADEFFPNQTIIDRAVIRKIDGSEIDLLDQNQGNTPFFRMIMKESMFEPMLSGTLFVQDKKSSGENLNFVGGEIFEISVKTPLSGADSDLQFSNDELGLVSEDNLYQSMRFYIFRVKSLTDEASMEIDSEVGPSTMWNLDFGPYELIHFNKTDAPLYDGEFIGKIASEDEDGLINYFAERYFSPTDLSTCQEAMDIEPTLNSIWFKGNHASYPYGKDNPYLELGRLMNYISENSVSGENANAVNYLFWQDLKKWHFRSVESLIKEQEGSSRTYKVSIDKTGKDKVQNFRMVKQIDQSELLNSDAYKSFYINVEPNYDDVYSDYMPTNDKLLKSRVDYDYRTDYESWSHIEGNPVLPSSLDYEDGNSNELHDDVHGWFNLGEYNDQHPTKFDYLDNENNKSDIKAWQTNFDITDLDIDLLKKIRLDVINPAEENYESYARKRLLKEKWNVYKYSVCCEKQPTQQVGTSRLLGYITDAERFAFEIDEQTGVRRDIWKYKWVPVEIWLTEELGNAEEIYGEDSELEIVADQGPFTVIKIPQDEGVTLEAYNVNEMNNGVTRKEGDEPFGAPYGPYLGPGYNKGNQSASGVNTSEYGTLYPNHYVPVGFMIRFSFDELEELDPNEDPFDQLNVNRTDFGNCRFIHAGHVVEIFETPTNLSILEKGEDASDTIYLFNVENVFDGACRPCLLETEVEGV